MSILSPSIIASLNQLLSTTPGVGFGTQLETELELLQTESGAVPSTSIYIDGNRTDAYTPNGTIELPYLTLHDALAAAESAGYAKAVVNIAPGTYTETGDITLPNIPMVIYGNNSAINCSGTITVTNPIFTRYDLITTGNVVYAGIGTSRTLIQGGSITGNITCDGLIDFKSCSLLSGIVTIASTGQLLAIMCTITSQFNSTGILMIENNIINTGKSTPLVTSTAGYCVLVNNILVNTGTGGAVSCNNGANGTTAINIIANNTITVASGVPIACGTAVTVYNRNAIVGGINTGTGFIPVNTDMIGGTVVMELGSDGIGDLYTRSSTGTLVRIAAPSSAMTLKHSGVAGSLPYWG
jgi:hypothetical protein